MKSKVLRNSTYLLSAQTLIKVLAFFYTLFLATRLGVEDYGLYIVALSYFSLISAISDFGISRYLIREIAIDTKSISSVLSNVLVFRLSLVCLTYIIFSLILAVFDPSLDRVNLSMIAVLAVIPQTIALTFDSIFAALQKLSLSSIGVVVLAVASNLGGVFLVLKGYGAEGAVVGLVLGQVIYAAVMLAIAYKQKVLLLTSLKKSLFKQIIVGSLPYGLLGVMGLIYFKIDALMLSYMKGSYETGIYGIAFRFIEATVFVPSAISTALFPVIAKLHEADSSQIKPLYYKSIKNMFLLSVPVMLGFMFMLPILFTKIDQFRDFLPAVPVLRILAITIPFMFIASPGGLVLMAGRKYLKSVIVISIFTMSFNILGNALVIPIYGYMGAAVTTVLSEVLTFGIFFVYLHMKLFRR